MDDSLISYTTYFFKQNYRIRQVVIIENISVIKLNEIIADTLWPSQQYHESRHH